MKKLLLLLSGLLWAQSSGEFFPFQLTMDFAPQTVVDWSWLNQAPAGSIGRVRLQNGHFFSGPQRLKWVGVNINQVPHRTAQDDVAKHLARFGVNIVRFHHLDAFWSEGVFGEPNDERPKIELNKSFLEQLALFLEVLQRHGIYVNLNLLTGRLFTSYDGLPKEIDQIEDFKIRHLLGFWFQPILELQKKYARDFLLFRRSPTSPMLKDAPNLAMVEINNEAGLIHSWQLGYLDHLPRVFENELQQRWNRWLMSQGGDARWIEAIQGRPAPDTGFSQASYSLETHEGAQATLRQGRVLRVEVNRASSEGWHVQLVRFPLNVIAQGVYELRLRVRSSTPRHLWVALAYARPPWTDLGWAHTVEVSQQWQTVTLRGVSAITENNARFLIGDLGTQTGWIEFEEIELYSPTLNTQQVPRPSRSQVAIIKRLGFEQAPRAVQHLWGQFLREVEEQYWKHMVDYVKRELGVQAPIAATIVSTVSPHLTQLWDVVDNHAYWQHPEFPGQPWDRNNYIVRNEPMVLDERLGVLGPLAMLRQANRPYTVTEYGHPLPNFFAPEGFVLLSTISALQDWDGYFGFSYVPPKASKGLFDYFDFANHPLVWASMGFGAQLFRQGGLEPAGGLKFQRFERSLEDNLANWYAWEGPNIRPLLETFQTGDLWTNRLGMVLDGESVSLQPQAPRSVVRWERQQGQFSVTTEQLLMTTGFVAGKRDTQGILSWEAGSNQSGWGQILFAQVRPQRWLLVAHGVARPQGLYPVLPKRGQALTEPFWEPNTMEVETLPLTVRLNMPVGYKVWALNERGARSQEVSSRWANGVLEFRIGQRDQVRTIWFEIAAQ